MSQDSPDQVVPTAVQTHEIASQRERGKDFRELADLLPMTVFEVDRQGRFTFVNRFGLEFSGYSAQELEHGISIAQIVLPDPGVSFVENFRRRIEGAPDTRSTYHFLTRDGQTKPITVHSNPIVEAGLVVGLRGVVVDLTEQKRVEEASARAERLEAAGRIAGQVAHDFNNLLAPVLAYPQLIREKLGPGHPALAYLNDMETATRQLAEINQQLLTLARRGHYDFVPLDINAVVRGVVCLIGDPPKDLRVNLKFGEQLSSVLGGEAQLGRAILNLVSNARDAMQDEGELTLETYSHETTEFLGVLGPVPAGRYVVVQVSDTGPGIAATHLKRIFEPFFSTKLADRRRGSGLGLSTACAVIQDHGGYLDVETRLGVGSTFKIYFPECGSPPSSKLPTPLLGGHEQVLVVDDEPMQRQVAQHLLERLGYEVHLAISGEHAIALVESGIVPDLVILDMVLGSGIDGAETYRQLLREIPCLRAIVLSAYAESDRVNVALELGAGRFLRKPIDLATIAASVREELDRVSFKRRCP